MEKATITDLGSVKTLTEGASVPNTDNHNGTYKNANPPPPDDGVDATLDPALVDG